MLTWKNIQNGCAKKYGNIPMHTYALCHKKWLADAYPFVARKLQTNHISYNTSMDACARDSHWREALYLLRPLGAVQMAGGQMCAAFELTFSVLHEGLFKVWIVKLCWLGRVQQNVSKYKMIFLLPFSFLCRLDTGTLLLMLVTRQSLSSVGTGRKELFALNTALSAGARGTEWRCLTFMDNFDRLHGWWFVMDGHWVMPCALRSGYPIAWADQVQVFQLQVLYHFVVFSEVQ